MKKILCLLLISVTILNMVSCGEEDTSDKADSAQKETKELLAEKEEKGENEYTEFIDRVAAGLKDGFKTDSIEELDISSVFNYGSTNLGYSIRDLDNDGVEELLFGEDLQEKNNGVIYDIYTIEDGEMVHVVAGWDRNRYYLCDNGMLANEGSSGASNSTYSYYTYKSSGLEQVEAEEIIDGCKYVDIEFTPFVDEE